MNYVNYADKKQLAGVKGFNDKEQRDAFKRMVKSCPVLYKYLYEYFNIDPNKSYKIIVDPLGEMKVDLGILCTEDNTIVGLVEVDYFKKWVTHRQNYKYCNRLARKEKYYKEHPYPYVNITFNVGGTSGIMTTKEVEQRYSLTEGMYQK